VKSPILDLIPAPIARHNIVKNRAKILTMMQKIHIQSDIVAQAALAHHAASRIFAVAVYDGRVAESKAARRAMVDASRDARAAVMEMSDAVSEMSEDSMSLEGLTDDLESELEEFDEARAQPEYRGESAEDKS
jgi:hypothetical protein